jgi:hypothetical protein
VAKGWLADEQSPMRAQRQSNRTLSQTGSNSKFIRDKMALKARLCETGWQTAGSNTGGCWPIPHTSSSLAWLNG